MLRRKSCIVILESFKLFCCVLDHFHSNIVKKMAAKLLTPETIKIIKATTPVVAANVENITQVFYKRMFERNPETLAYFNKSHQQKGSQPKTLAGAVATYATHIENLDALGPLVARMSHRHVALSITPNLYQVVHDNLLAAVGEVLGDAVTPEIGSAWSSSVLALAQILIDAEENLYKRNEARVGGWRLEREFELVEKVQVAEETARFRFKPTDGYDGPFEFKNGEYLTIRLPGIAPRHYTLVSRPNEDHFLEICTRLAFGGTPSDPDGEASTYMHNTLKVGDKVLLGAPCGVFTASDDCSSNVLISAGIGCTPMLSFVQQLGKAKIFKMLHVETEKERDAMLAFKDLIGDIPLKTIYTGPDFSSTIDVAAEAKTLVDESPKDSQFFICGPVPFMSAFKSRLEQAGAPADAIHYEIFGTGTLETVPSDSKL